MIRVIVLFFCAALAAQAKLTPEQREKFPPPADHPVDFSREVKPILEASCIKCHGRGKAKGGFAVDNRESFLKGGETGPAVILGKSAESLLIEMVSGLDPDNVMPQKGSKLTTTQVGILRAWIDQNLPWDSAVSFGKLPPINLHPRHPEVPAGEFANPIDRFVADYFQKHNSRLSGPVEDRLFARRAYLDVIGLLPTPAELEKFEKSAAPDKRSRLIDQLLDRKMDYAVHWLSFWNDMLRNDYKGTGYIDGGRKQITSWLFSALASNKPYNQFVAELINPTPESEGFAKGIVWRGVVNASQTPQMQAAQNISQVFMGVNLKCASCHDSFINDWTLADAYGLASIYADGPLEMFKCDAPTGQKAAMKFIYPELGEISTGLSREDRLKRLAEVVTAERNGRLTRTIVNRLWARFLGRGLVEPVDEMDNPAWNQDLLDWLAADLADHGFDLKRTIRLILTSRTYQLPAVPAPERQKKEFVFEGPLVRRVSAEQFVDAAGQLTGVEDRVAAAHLNYASATGQELKADFSDQPAHPRWIWSHDRAATRADANTVYFRKFIDLASTPTDADLVVSCDNSFKIYLNGKEAGSGKDFSRPVIVDARKHLRPGINLIAVAARNWPGAPDKQDADQANPAGFWLYGHVRSGTNVMDFASDSSWLWAVDAPEGWFKPDFTAANWNRAAELGDSTIAPWNLGMTLAEAAANLGYGGSARAALANNDPLMTALGRCNREQVMTSRPSAATTLQALELTNGGTLAAQLKHAGEEIARHNSDPDPLLQKLFVSAFGRGPTDSERALSKDMLGSPVKPEGVEDLLWTVLMLPEFQLIY